MQQRALVTGATGGIGPTLVNHLLANGYCVRTYSRQPASPTLFCGEVEHVQGDIRDERMVNQAMRDVDVVFHLAALLHIENPHEEMREQYDTINILGTKQVARAALCADVRRLVYFSTVKVYGTQQRDAVREDSMLHPTTLYAQTKLRGEQAVRAEQGLESVVLRLSAVYGSRLAGSWERMIRAIARGRFIPVGNLQNRRSLTYVEDVACAAQFAAEARYAAGKTYNVVGQESPSMQEILAAIYCALGQPMPSLRIPTFAALGGMRLLSAGMALAHKRMPLSVEAIRQLVIDEVYSGEKLRGLGFKTATPLEYGWKQAVEGMVR